MSQSLVVVKVVRILLIITLFIYVLTTLHTTIESFIILLLVGVIITLTKIKSVAEGIIMGYMDRKMVRLLKKYELKGEKNEA